MASLRDPKLMQSPRCQHPTTSHSYAHSWVPCSSQQIPARPVHHLGAAVPPDGEAHKMEIGGTTTRCIPETEADAYKQHVLAHFDPSCPVGISCDASESGVGAVLFHRYKDNSEHPIANASKTLTDGQKRYPQIQKEALSIIFALKKYHQFLYGRSFILVTDHKPLISMFGPNTATPMLAANHLARWSLMLSQYDYTIEYRSTKQHGNADALSRLPVGPDLSFDGEEGDNNVDTVCTIRVINSQWQHHSRNQLKDATNRDPVLSEVKRYVREA